MPKIADTVAITAEIKDLSGLLVDLYARVSRSEPGSAATIANLLHENARSFAMVGASQPGRLNS